ncbi:hypothetical protein NS365_05630 [Aureimonas ureilytica]|uniref:DUF3572 domain-containing protein n=2 Tax=Aureimonas ureilytica TaxID=401562 RepID=A0A175RTZ8_9HYPH|nr:hypothetical protein NS365_05630 [Aureimonas ureilytica]
MRDRKTRSGKDAETIGIEALSFLASDQDLMQRFLDVTGIEADEVRTLVSHQSFFVGVLDFISAHEPTLMTFCGFAALQPDEVSNARRKLDAGW